ncbi:hypothetical protein L208DRAFT_148698 [Tricholoma matsutake]|nr:hypothetical protein L208DRAFT_148698 [Tricholoma matsutake 945]
MFHALRHEYGAVSPEQHRLDDARYMPGRNSTSSHLPVVQFPALVSFIGWIVPYILPYSKIERLALYLDAQRNFQPIIASLASRLLHWKTL